MAPDPGPLTPQDVLRLDAGGALELLDDLERRVPRRQPCVDLPTARDGSAFVFGDSHGDWYSTVEAVGAFEQGGPDAVLVGLGDYIDRSPSDLPCGSVANALYLLGLAARWPSRVFLLQGNHETQRRIAGAPHTLPDEVRRLWGASHGIYDRLMGLLERGPLAASARSGAYFAHGGFPRGPLPNPWQRALDDVGEERLLELVWAEPDVAPFHRGAIAPWTQADLERFLTASGLHVMFRGHDPDVAGRPLYRSRVLTLHTSRLYQRYGGVLMSIVPLARSMNDVRGAELRHLASESIPVRR